MNGCGLLRCCAGGSDGPRPKIFNTDQGSQFASFAFTSILREVEVRISMGGRGRWMDNVFIARLWRSLKCECVYLHAFDRPPPSGPLGLLVH